MTIISRPAAQVRSDTQRAEYMRHLGFGRIFSEHMVVAHYQEGQGWSTPILQSYGPIALDPAASVLHYGQSIFEGLKAYAQPDGGVAIFRPLENAKRFNQSAARLVMPPFPELMFEECAQALVRQDHQWVPKERGDSLYLRPLMFATEPALGVRPSGSYTFILFASPSGSYFTQGLKAVSVWISQDYIRAAPGGTGFAKFAGNYAAGLIGQQEAKEHGCDQVVWLDAVEHKYIEEMGGMNIFFVQKKGSSVTLVTPKLTGTLLPGITRQTILDLATHLGLATEERLVTLEEWKTKSQSGEFVESFACGTASVVTPIREAKMKNDAWMIHGGEVGPISHRLRETLLDIQHGHQPDTHGWLKKVL